MIYVYIIHVLNWTALYIMVKQINSAKNQLGEEEKMRIIRLKERGYKIDVIANIYEIERSTVNRIIKKFKATKTTKRTAGTWSKIKYHIDDQIVCIVKDSRKDMTTYYI